MKYRSFVYMLITIFLEDYTENRVSVLIKNHPKISIIGFTCLIGITGIAFFTIQTRNKNKKNKNSTKEEEKSKINQNNANNLLNSKNSTASTATTLHISESPGSSNLMNNSIIKKSSFNNSNITQHQEPSQKNNNASSLNVKEVQPEKKHNVLQQTASNNFFKKNIELTTNNRSPNNDPSLKKGNSDNSNDHISPASSTATQLEKTIVPASYNTKSINQDINISNSSSIMSKSAEVPQKKSLLSKNNNIEEEKINKETKVQNNIPPISKTTTTIKKETRKKKESTKKDNELSLSDPDNKKIFIAYVNYNLKIHQKNNKDESEKNNDYKQISHLNPISNEQQVMELISKCFYSVYSYREFLIQQIPSLLNLAPITTSWDFLIYNYLNGSFILTIENNECSEKQIKFLSKFIAQEIYSIKKFFKLFLEEQRQILMLKLHYYTEKSKNIDEIPKISNGCRNASSLLNIIIQPDITSMDLNFSSSNSKEYKEVYKEVITMIVCWRKQIYENCKNEFSFKEPQHSDMIKLLESKIQ